MENTVQAQEVSVRKFPQAPGPELTDSINEENTNEIMDISGMSSLCRSAEIHCFFL
ncbi:MAG TPA: hypothetical protein HA306_03980 [Methanosarcina sp.]|nr:hypothetical protein [Methanosarcina sp.]